MHVHDVQTVSAVTPAMVAASVLQVLDALKGACLAQAKLITELSDSLHELIDDTEAN